MRGLAALLSLALGGASVLRSPSLDAPRHQIPSVRLGKPSPRATLSQAHSLSADESHDFEREEDSVQAGGEEGAVARGEDEPLPERRIDEDGGAYTKEEFLAFYREDGEKLWQASEVASEELSYAVEVARLEAEDAKKSALTKLRRSAMKEISKLRQMVAETTQSAMNATTALAELAAEFAGFKEKAAGELSAAEERASAAEERAALAISAAESERSGRLEAEVIASTLLSHFLFGVPSSCPNPSAGRRRRSAGGGARS